MNVKYFIIGWLCFNSCWSLGQDVVLLTQTEVDAFDSSITSINGDLLIGPSNNIDRILDLSNLSNVESISGDFHLQSLHHIPNLNGLESITTVGGEFYLRGAHEITNVDGLTGLASVGDEFRIQANDELTNIDGLSSLEYIGGDLKMYYNDELLNIDGFGNVTTIGGLIDISSNDNISNIDGFQNLVSVGNKIKISGNRSLKNVDGFIGLTSVNGFLTIGGLELENIDGLSNITEVSLSLKIEYANHIENLDGLSSLTNVGLNLEIFRNYDLVDVDGLSNLQNVGGDLIIQQNNELEDCCGLLHLVSDMDSIGGSISIGSNLESCNSVTEIINSDCGLELLVRANSPCIGADNGFIELQVENETNTPYYYKWKRVEDNYSDSGQSDQNDLVIEHLIEGTYNITVTTNTPSIDVKNGIQLTAIDGSIFEIVELVSTNSSFGFNNGSIVLTFSGGNPPYSVNWSGPTSGNITGIEESQIELPNLKQGEYQILASDNNFNSKDVLVTLLDDTNPIFECSEPLDVLILNDVSGSVDETEYNESKSFFVDFINVMNIGNDNDQSRVGIVEWSGVSEQEVQIPFSGDLSLLQTYSDFNRKFNGGTNPHEALNFAEEYMESFGREDVEKVVVLSTDGGASQISSSLIELAANLKANGYHIVTIAFDEAYSSSTVRTTLKEVASFDALAPGASAYSLLDDALAENIVNLYICPVDPGMTATAYFNRDGVIDILNISHEGNCPFPSSVEISMTIEAQKELSIPSGAFVTFYDSDPALFAAASLLTWQLPCAIESGTKDTFYVDLPSSGPGNIYVVFNDNGSSSTPLELPNTELDEISFANNIDFDSYCINAVATLQANRYTTTPIPVCDTIINYVTNVCNVSEVDAYDVLIDIQVPDSFVWISTVINDNGCSEELDMKYDIPANCCVSIATTFDAGSAPFGNYDSLDVILSGPLNQTYFNFTGSDTVDEDVVLNGDINCPSSIIEFEKTVNLNESCDNGFITYTYTINNELNVPLQGLNFYDELTGPANWVFRPYAKQGLSMMDFDLDGDIAEFTIDQVEPNTVASFSIDVNLSIWPFDGNITSSALLDNVPDLMNGGLQILTSNSTNTEIFASPQIELIDTIYHDINVDTLEINASINTIEGITWTSSGDGSFTGLNSEQTNYILGEMDRSNEELSLSISVESDCNEIGSNVVVILEDPLSLTEKDQWSDKYSISPNPSKGILIIEATNKISPVQLEIYNTKGEKIKENEGISRQIFELNLEDILPGLYFISIIDNEGRSVYKWMKF